MNKYLFLLPKKLLHFNYRSGALNRFSKMRQEISQESLDDNKKFLEQILNLAFDRHLKSNQLSLS